jgi:hypothetical protein
VRLRGDTVGFRLFGRGKEEESELSCCRCGRTLLAGEWTQRVAGDDGVESRLCPLCAADEQGIAGSDETTFETTPAGNGRVRSTRSDSDTFWRALKEKDAEIERLESRLARVEAEKQELAAELAGLRGFGSDGHETGFVSELAAPARETEVVGPPILEPEAGVDAVAPVADPPVVHTEVVHTEVEHTDPGLADKLRAQTSLEEVAPEETAPLEVPTAAAPAAAPAAPADAPDATAPADADDASLTILQRAVDLLNVSAVPRRIVETNESLGIPSVHIGSEGVGTLLITFLWTLGWYQFRVELNDGGRVTLVERGYDQRTDLPPNANVRPDGTVQIAPTMIRQAAARAEAPGRDEGPPTAPTTTSGVIISKSLMGQRTDDENVPPAWGSANAPDFDWGR